MTGHVQLGSAPDRSGRLIAWAFPGLRSGASVWNELRGNVYIGMDMISLMEDVSRVTITLSYHVGEEFKEKCNPNFGEAMKAALSLPCNIAAYHFCFSSRVEAWLAQTAVAVRLLFIIHSLLYVMPPHLRAKTKIHFGSHQECQYYLSSYGIPRETFPFTPNHVMDLTYHRFWLQQCIQKEQTTSSSPEGTDRNIRFLTNIENGETPTDNDFLCVVRKVKGKGNERLMSLVVTKLRMLMTTMLEVSWKRGILSNR